MLALVILAVVLLTGCGRDTLPRAGPVKRDPNHLVVYCSCALLPLVEAAREEFISANPTKSLEIASDDPRGLVQRLSDGEVPDIFVCLGETEIGDLERDGHLDRGSRRSFGMLVPVIAVPQGNPAAVGSPDDLLLERVKRIAIAAPGMTSMGTDAKHELERAQLWSRLQDKLAVKTTSVAVLEAISAGEVEAGIVYDPCPRLNVGEDIPLDSLLPATPLAAAADRPARIYAEVHKRSPNALLAQRFLRILEEREVGVSGVEPSEGEPAEELEEF
jgi:ABC-type molybdate transport system substrate-binding protein